MIPTKAELSKLYLDDDRQINEIARIYSRSRQMVYKWFKQHGIERKDYFVWFKCDYCGQVGKSRKKTYAKSEKHFCSKECYQHGYMHNPEYRQRRQGQRIGRILMKEFLEAHGILMNYDMVVHHVDGDNNNNDLSNLMVFNNASEHLAYHHKLRRERLRGTESKT